MKFKDECEQCNCCGASGNILTVGSGKQYATLQNAVDAAQPGDTIEIDGSSVFTGTAANTSITKDNLAIKGVNGRPRFEGCDRVEVTGRKGIFVVSGKT